MPKIIPEIRFKGFEEEWCENSFKNTFSNLGNNTLSRADLNYNFGLAKNIHYGDILIKFGEILDVKKSEIPFITNCTLTHQLKSISLQDGDVIIADAAEDETVGKCTELINVGEEIIISGLHTIALRPLLHFAPRYLGFYMNSTAYHNQLLRLMQGTKVLSISKSAIKNTRILYPSKVNEQTQIGTYFQQLDQLIILHQKKYDKLIILKKAMLEKMFPKPGATTPEIRFKGFEGDWEEKRLGEVVDDFYSGQTPYRMNESFWKGSINWLTSGELNRSIVYSTEEKITKAGQKSANLRSIEKGTFVLAITGLEAAGTRGNCAILGIDTTMNQSCMAVSPNPDLLKTRFLFQWYRKNSEEFGLKYTQGTKQQSYNIGILEKLDICLPSTEEQFQIGNYFENLDNLISLNQSQLEKLKNIKKGCLEKMFV